MEKHWANNDRDKRKFRTISISPDIKRARATAKNEKIAQGVEDQRKASRQGMDYGSGIAVTLSAKKKERTRDKARTKDTGNKRVKCKCGSVTHQRTSSRECHLNTKNNNKRTEPQQEERCKETESRQGKGDEQILSWEKYAAYMSEARIHLTIQFFVPNNFDSF